MKENLLDLSITIVTWNCKKLLINSLNSIYQKIKGLRLEIIVVDNNSTDGTVQIIEEDFPNIYLIKNNVNKGVAKARNQAIKIARGKYILILDADTEIISSNFSDLIDYMGKQKGVGILGCSMTTGDNRHYISARTLPSPHQIILRRLAHYGFFKNSKILKSHHLGSQDITDPIVVGYVIGAFQLMRKEYIEIIGPLDEKMFYGYEDADYCARMKRYGFSAVYFPNFTIRHYVRGLTREKPFNKLLFEHIKSYMRFYLKHHDLL